MLQYTQQYANLYTHNYIYYSKNTSRGDVRYRVG